MNHKLITFNRKSAGFTLIELLIAITIMAILTGTATVAFDNVRDKGRDNKRKQDLGNIKGALSLYYEENKQYPYDSTDLTKTAFASDEGTNWIPNLVSTYIQKLPKDPRQSFLNIFNRLANLFMQGEKTKPQSQVAGSSVNNPSTVGTACCGSLVWSTPQNAATSNDTYATVNADTGYGASNYLKATGFPFSIPAGASIDGVEVRVERREGSLSTNAFDSSVRLVVAGNPTGEDKARTFIEWPVTDQTVVYGGPTDKWGTSITANDVNSPDFGAAFSATFSGGAMLTIELRVDAISITVYYTPAPPTPPTCAIDIPTNGATVSGVQGIKVTAGGGDGDPGRPNLMEIIIDGTLVHQVIWADSLVMRSENWPWNTTTYSNGSPHTITCRVTEGTAGTESTTPPITVTVNNPGPQVTKILRPSANGDFNEWSSGDPNNWQYVNQPETYSNYGMSQPTPVDDNGIGGSGALRQFFQLPDGEIPAGATNISVVLWGEGSTNCTGANCPMGVKFVARLGASESYTNAGFEKLTLTGGRYQSASFSTNPTGVAWDPADIDKLQIGLKDVSIIGMFGSMGIAKFFATVTYTPGAAPTPGATPTPPPPTPPSAPGCSNKPGVYCYIVTIDHQSYTLWAQLDNKKDPEIYTEPGATCRNTATNPDPTLFNYCLEPNL